MNTVTLVDLANKNFNNPDSIVIAMRALRSANELKDPSVNRARAKLISEQLRRSGESIAKLEALMK